MNSKYCKNQLYSSHFVVFFITKLYTIFYYLHYFLLFSKCTYYFVWRNLPTNSNYLFYKNLLTIFGYSNYHHVTVLSYAISMNDYQLALENGGGEEADFPEHIISYSKSCKTYSYPHRFNASHSRLSELS